MMQNDEVKIEFQAVGLNITKCLWQERTELVLGAENLARWLETSEGVSGV